jgi:two-component system, OmpR family, sensor kinase
MSLRTRLLCGLSLAAVVLLVAIWIVVERQRDFLLTQIDSELTSAGPFVAVGVGEPSFGDLVGPLPPPPDTPGAEFAPDPISDLYIGVIDDGFEIPLVSGALLDRMPAWSADDRALLESTRSDAADPAGPEAVRFTLSDGFRALAVPGVGVDWIVVAKPTADADASVRRLAWTLGLAAAFVLVTMAAVAWWVIRLGLRPITTMTSTVSAIAAGDRARRVDVSASGPEVSRLGDSFNALLDQRDDAERRLRRFVSDASHELRTPLTSLRGYTELMRASAFDAEQTHDVLRRMGDESQRMSTLVDDLLLLAQLDEGRPLQRDALDVELLLSDVAEAARVRQPERPVRVGVVAAADVARRPLHVDADPLRIRQLLDCVVQNALVHTPATASLALSARWHDASASADGTVTSPTIELVVSDDGPGMPEPALAGAFERFSRIDPSRSRHTGGAGLGLSIAQAVAEAHGTTLRLTSKVGSGTTVAVTLPEGQPG